MRLILYILIFVLSPLLLLAQNEYKVEDLIILSDSSLVTDKSGRPINGVIRKYSANGKILEEVVFQNGVLNGIFKIYYESGPLQYEVPYKNGKKEGVVREYFESGNIKNEFVFKNDLENGLYKEYNEAGELIREINFSDGMMNGIEKRYKAGEQWLEITYKNDIAVNCCCVKGRRKIYFNKKEIEELNQGNIAECGL